ncbi:MAG: phosphoenolpyruvate carboxykinase (ATP), partial [Flavobacteriales bacterium]|nr:phosphoenolpyruvate carboxykinase (ATP) [Flavobacteriales bacterium]
TKDTVWWEGLNHKFSALKFDALQEKMIAHLDGKELFVRDVYACSYHKYRLNIRVINENPWMNLFVSNMFIEPSIDELKNFTPQWTIICAPEFNAIPERDGTRQHNFAILNFSKKTILIGGTAYTGEIKKGIFSVLNFILPIEENVFSMHCSANVGKEGDTAIFFGLSGTGKTTLSADPERQLIGDDEHGWSENTVFNFEGGCYAKCINLTKEDEPQIFNAIRPGALLENIVMNDNRIVDYTDISKTQNTRVSYPIEFIDNVAQGSKGASPRNIFMLTCDAHGVLPAISKLTKEQAMYHFISGYTAKVAGTESDITEPVMVFSACFGEPFLPIHPGKYADMLGEKMDNQDVNVWLINTGWQGGPYGIGERIKLKYTRRMIKAALSGELNKVEYLQQAIFGLHMPSSCPGIPEEILNPRRSWPNTDDYDEKAFELADAFIENFSNYETSQLQHIMKSAPKTKLTI